MVNLNCIQTKTDIDSQIIKIATKYYNTHQLYKQGVESEEYLSCLFDFIYSKNIKDKYNPDRGTLATFIYDLLDKYTNNFVYSIRNGITFAETRRIFKKHGEDERLNNFISPVSLANIDDSDDNSADTDSHTIYHLEDTKTNVVDSIEKREIIKQALDFLDNNKDMSDKTKEMIRYYISCYGEVTQQTVADKFNVSKQCFNQALFKFRKKLASAKICQHGE